MNLVKIADCRGREEANGSKGTEAQSSFERDCLGIRCRSQRQEQAGVGRERGEGQEGSRAAGAGEKEAYRGAEGERAAEEGGGRREKERIGREETTGGGEET